MSWQVRHTAGDVGSDWKSVGGKIRTAGPNGIDEDRSQQFCQEIGLGQIGIEGAQRINMH